MAPLLAQLVDKSMIAVAAAPTGRVSRYTLLETMRAYGRDRLAERKETDAAHRAHAQYYAVLVSELDRLSGPDAAGAGRAIARELDEVRAAHAWSLDHDPDLALRLVSALANYSEHSMLAEIAAWAELAAAAAAATHPGHPLLPVAYGIAAGGARFRGDLARAAALADRALAEAADPADPARRFAQYILGEIALLEGRLADCGRLSEDVERLARAAGDDLRMTWSRVNQVLIRAYSGDHADAIALADSVRQHAERGGDPGAVAWSRYAAGEARLEAEPDVAITLLEEALAGADAVADRYLTGVALVSAASVRGRHGDPRDALPLFRDVVQHWHAAGDWTHQWTTVRNVVDLLARVGADEAAAVLYGAVTSRATAAPVYGADAERLDEVRRIVSQRLGPAAWAAAVTRGSRLTDDEVVRFATATLTPGRGRIDVAEPHN